MAQWIQRVETNNPTRVLNRWYVTAAIALAGTEQRADADRAQRAVLATGIPPYDAGDALQMVGPFLPLQKAAARTFIARLNALVPTMLRTTGPTRLQARDPAVVEEATELLRNPNLDGSLLRAALLIAGLGANETPTGTLRARMVSLREQTRAFSTYRVEPREIDAWIEAVSAVDACHGARPCLAGLVSHGAEATAARALFVLGPRGLAALDATSADALVRRLASAASVPLASAFALTVQGCPARLRGAAESRVVADDVLNPIRAFFAEFTATCNAPH
jgi:hypothetical protein